jgi:hypothetical protein
MRCVRCQAEIPSQAQFCMQCGTPVNAARSSGAYPPMRPVSAATVRAGMNKRRAAGIAAALLLLAVGAFLAWNKLQGGKVTEASGAPFSGGPLTERSGRVGPAGPITEKPGRVEAGPPDKQEVIDYLKFLREIERQRVSLEQQQTGQVLNWSSQLTVQNLNAEMGDRPEEAHRQTYTKFQQDLAQWQNGWQELSKRFLSYGKPVPQSCAQLHDKYFNLLSKTSAAMATVANSFSQAMSGDASKALDALNAMRGTASSDVDQACEAADSELAAVCEKYNLRKDYDIRPDSGASNPFGVGR